MKTRMNLATGLVLVAVAAAACGTGERETTPSATTTAPPTSAPAPSPSASEDAATLESAADLVGEWSAPEAEWVVTFAEDGTFSEDFQGNEGFRTGTYELEDGIVSLVGGDGNTDRGEVEGTSLVFRLGTLERS